MEQMDVDSETPNLNGGVAVANGAEPVDAEEDTNAILGLDERILAIRAHCDAIQKENAGMGTGHAIDAVLSAVRPLVDQYNILIVPHLKDVKYDGNRCNVMVLFRWSCTEAFVDETLEVMWGGSDTDKAGKGLSKAMTNALKEHLKKMFLITDRSDQREETDQVEHQTDEGLTREAVNQAEDSVRAMFEAWAKNYINAIKGAADVKALQRIKRDNADQLGHKDLPGTTKSYLEDQYAERLKVLKEFEADANEETLS
ncbi:MAG: hypothetical protein AAF583_01470 [Pseudomonadota bacterium]